MTGSREFTDWRTIMGALIGARAGSEEVPTVVHGCARGADFLAAQSARKLCWNVEDHGAHWDRHGKAAGYIRNAEMVDAGADVCLAFFQHGAKNRGTTDCVSRARAAGIPVREFWNDHEW